MRKIFVFALCATMMSACVSQKKYNDMLMRNQFDKDSLLSVINSCQKNLEKTTALEEQLEKNVVSLRADSLSKKRQIENLTSQNAELKQLNTNLTNKQSAMIKQQAAESKKTLEELQIAREKLQNREDELDSIQLSLEQERKNLDKIRRELGIKDNEILAK
ncbi:MAG: hypothetical protein II663_06990, partial [Bacteroidales bacterium]|nr:hypothetical protein [Bacteroidales bacterium]